MRLGKITKHIYEIDKKRVRLLPSPSALPYPLIVHFWGQLVNALMEIVYHTNRSRTMGLQTNQEGCNGAI